MTDIADLLDAIAADCHAVEDRLRWAHTEGWIPGRADRDRPSKPRDPDADPDVVPGAPRDPGIGNANARGAIALARPSIGQAERHALLVAHHYRLNLSRKHGPNCNVDDLLAAVANVRTVIGHLRKQSHVQVPVVRALDRVRRNLDSAWRQLAAAFRDPASPDAVIADLCIVCTIRPKSVNPKTNKPNKGGRCATCAQWKTRNPDGPERPRSLDTRDVPGARAAKIRRVGRSEGWGNESLSCTGPIEPDPALDPPVTYVLALTKRHAVSWCAEHDIEHRRRDVRIVTHLTALAPLDGTGPGYRIRKADQIIVADQCPPDLARHARQLRKAS